MRLPGTCANTAAMKARTRAAAASSTTGSSPRGTASTLWSTAPSSIFVEQRHRLAFDHHAGRKRRLRQHEAVDRRAVVPDGPGNEAVGKGIGGRDLDGAQPLERALVVDVLSP